MASSHDVATSNGIASIFDPAIYRPNASIFDPATGHLSASIYGRPLHIASSDGRTVSRGHRAPRPYSPGDEPKSRTGFASYCDFERPVG
jgi:hypothetical protein